MSNQSYGSGYIRNPEEARKPRTLSEAEERYQRFLCELDRLARLCEFRVEGTVTTPWNESQGTLAGAAELIKQSHSARIAEEEEKAVVVVDDEEVQRTVVNQA
ncbi:hypothetical protein IAT40_003619 [Kwoniella sp. CBS 6097]